MWQPIETAPKDGTWIILAGGSFEDAAYDDVVQVGPAVIAFWDENLRGWAFSYWDGAWRSEYDGPTRWHPLPHSRSA